SKKILSAIGTEFVYGGHLLSLGATGIVLTVVLILNLPVKLIILVIPYLISQVVYSYNHYKEIDEDLDSNPERSKFIQQQKKQLGWLLIGYIILMLVLSLL